MHPHQVLGGSAARAPLGKPQDRSAPKPEITGHIPMARSKATSCWSLADSSQHRGEQTVGQKICHFDWIPWDLGQNCREPPGAPAASARCKAGAGVLLLAGDWGLTPDRLPYASPQSARGQEWDSPPQVREGTLRLRATPQGVMGSPRVQGSEGLDSHRCYLDLALHGSKHTHTHTHTLAATHACT